MFDIYTSAKVAVMQLAVVCKTWRKENKMRWLEEGGDGEGL